MNKKLFVFTSSLFCVLLCIAAAIVLFAASPLHPKNITDKTICEKGTEYTVRLKGISEYDEKGFSVSPDGFYLSSDKVAVYVDDEGFARTTYDGEGESYIKGRRYNSTEILYEKYSFCGESYKNRQELEAFFRLPDPIYNFDLDKLSYYIQDIINYEKQFSGKATIKIYRGRCIFTEIYIGEEKVLELNR